jgi:hypothetical protein
MRRLHWIVVGALGAGLGAILFLGWRFAIHPLDAAYAAKVDEKAQLEAKLSDAKQRAAQFEKFQAEAENVRRDLEFYSRRLDEPLDREQLYGTLMSILGGLSLRVSKAEVETKQDPKSKGEVHSVNLEFSADLDRLGKLLDACVQQQHIFMPNSIELTRYEDPEGEYRDTMKVKLLMDVYSGARGGK